MPYHYGVLTVIKFVMKASGVVPKSYTLACGPLWTEYIWGLKYVED